MTPEGGLHPNLIALAGVQPHFDQRSVRKCLEHTIVGDRLGPLRVLRVRQRLLECVIVPGQTIAPSALGGLRAAVDDGPVHTLGLSPHELVLDRLLRSEGLREHDDPGGVAIDAMDDEGLATAARPEMIGDETEGGRRVLSSSQRDRQQARGLC